MTNLHNIVLCQITKHSLTLSLSLSLSHSYFLPFSLHSDNDYEIGEEPEHTWGWSRYKGKPKLRGRGKTPKHHSTKLDGWLSKRKKINNLIDECDAILNSASDRLSKTKETLPKSPSLTAVNLASLPGNSLKDANTKREEKDSDSETVIYDYEEGRATNIGEESGCQGDGRVSPPMVECPLCGNFFPQYAIEVHAASCSENSLPTATSVNNVAIPVIMID